MAATSTPSASVAPAPTSVAPASQAPSVRSPISRAGTPTIVERPVHEPSEFELLSLGPSLRGDVASSAADNDAASGDQEQDEDADLGEVDDSEDEGAETPSSDRVEPAKPQLSPAEWASILSTAPQRWTEVPRKLVGPTIAAIAAAGQAESANARRIGADEGRRAAAHEAQLRAAVAEIDELQRTDPEGFAQLATENPSRMANYLAAKRDLAPVSPEAMQREAQRINAAAAPHLQRVSEYPEAHAKIVARHQQGAYSLTPEGLAELAIDVEREIAAAMAAREAPTTRKAAEREAAAQQHSAKPKPLSTSGNAAAGELTVDGIKAMTQQQILAAMNADPEWEAKAQRALTRGK